MRIIPLAWNTMKKKKVWVPLLIVVVIVVVVVRQRTINSQPQYSTEPVRRQDLVQTVSATGTVEAAEELQLNFKTVGRLATLRVAVGDRVAPGQALARLEARDVESALLQAQANLKSAQAALMKLRAGASPQDAAVYESAVETAATALANTRATQAQAVANALAQLLGLAPSAVPSSSNVSTATLTISGTYVATERGTYTIRVDSSAPLSYSLFGLETELSVPGSRTTPTALGSRGLKLQWSDSGTLANGDSWAVELPNRSHASYAALEAAYQAALVAEKQQVAAAERALADARVKLAQVLAPAQSYDLTAAEAAVDAARAALMRTEADLADRAIVAPTHGVVTKVGNQVGETTSLASPVLVLLAMGNHQVKVQVPESDIAKLTVGQVVDMTLDAFGIAEHFSGHISFIDPASTVIQDVVYYEVTVLFDEQDERVKPGMTANVDVQTAELKSVLVAPARAVKYDGERRAYVEVLAADGTLERRDVAVGLRGDDGLVEVRQGLGEGDVVVTFKQNGKR